MKTFINFINEKLTLCHYINEKLTLNKQSKILPARKLKTDSNKFKVDVWMSKNCNFTKEELSEIIYFFEDTDITPLSITNYYYENGTSRKDTKELHIWWEPYNIYKYEKTRADIFKYRGKFYVNVIYNKDGSLGNYIYNSSKRFPDEKYVTLDDLIKVTLPQMMNDKLVTKYMKPNK